MLSKMGITKLLKGNKKVPAGFYVLNIPLIIIKRKKTPYIPRTHLKVLRSSPVYNWCLLYSGTYCVYNSSYTNTVSMIKRVYMAGICV